MLKSASFSTPITSNKASRLLYPVQNWRGKYDRLLQFTRLYLYGPSAGLFTCPLAMTDGAAFLIKNTLKKDAATLEPKVKAKLEEAFQNLTSRDPARFWTSGQWMTERKGGSDVARSTETVAVHVGGPVYKLYGDKYENFCDFSKENLLLCDLDGSRQQLTQIWHLLWLA